MRDTHPLPKRRSRFRWGILAAFVLALLAIAPVHHQIIAFQARSAVAHGRTITVRECNDLVESGQLIGQPRHAITPLVPTWTPYGKEFFAFVGNEKPLASYPFSNSVILVVKYDDQGRCTSARIARDSPA